MNWYELRRIAVATVAIDLLVVAACLALCALFFSVSSLAVGTALLFAAMLLVFVGGGSGGSIQPLRLSGAEQWTAQAQLPEAEKFQSETLIHHRADNLQRTLYQLRGLSWTMVFLFAAVPVFALSIFLIMWGP